MPRTPETPAQKEHAVNQYLIEDTTRPPFTFELRESRFERANEKRVFEMEKRVFRAPSLGTEVLPPLPEGLPEGHPLPKVHAKLIRAYGELNETIADIKALIDAAPLVRDKVLKGRLNYHFAKKKFYLEALITYADIYSRTKGVSSESANQAAELYQEAEIIYLAHQTYTAVRTFTHESSSLREDGDTTMKHVYEVSIGMMNFFFRKLDRETDPKKREKLYRRMKEGVVVALMHDLKEDHREAELDNLYAKVESLCEPDGRLSESRSSRMLKRPKHKRHNFYGQNRRGAIKRKMKVLTKPENKNDREGYITRQFLTNDKTKEAHLKTVEERVDMIVTKILDRGSNLQTLRYMQAKEDETMEARQNRKIEETKEIIDLANQIFELSDDEDLLEEIIELCNFCLEEAGRLEQMHFNEILRQRLQTRVAATRTLFNAELESAMKKAA